MAAATDLWQASASASTVNQHDTLPLNSDGPVIRLSGVASKYVVKGRLDCDAFKYLH